MAERSRQEIERLAAAVSPPRGPCEEVLRARLDGLAKPPGSLGRLEDLAVRLARILGDPPPRLPARDLFLLVADHGVSRRGVSAYAREVTEGMCRILDSGASSAHALARACGVRVIAADLGVDADVSALPGVLPAKVRRGTRDLSRGPALTGAEAAAGILAGAALVREHASGEPTLIALGEMGIGNTTAAAAVAGALAGAPAEMVVGPGTGATEDRLRHKRELVQASLRRIPGSPEPLRILVEVGGLEIAGLAGVTLQAARRGWPVLVDGFIATAAAALAAALAPAVGPHLFAAHLSPEPGHRILLDLLGLEPILDLDLRLGEGTGAILAAPIVDAAGRVLREVATLEQVTRPGT